MIMGATIPAAAAEWPRAAQHGWLAAVVAVHVAVLAIAVLRPVRVEPPVQAPTIIGALITVPPVEAVRARPAPSAPPVQRARVTPPVRAATQSAVPPVQSPAPPTPASERAPSSAAERPASAASNVQIAAATDAPAPGATPSGPAVATAAMSVAAKSAAPVDPAAVVPPRADASQLDYPAPVYPVISRRLGEQGRVLLDVHILPDGSVGEIRLKRSSGHARLDDAAIEAVRRWHYLPARRGGEPIPWWYVQPIAFALNG